MSTYCEQLVNSRDVNETLQIRGKVYGEFKNNSTVAQLLKQVVRANGKHLSDAHIEALEVICQKMSRILCGDSNYKDNWQDIAGYAKLAEDLCRSE